MAGDHETRTKSNPFLTSQIERLRRKIRKMEDEHQDLTSRLNDTTTMANATVNIQEVLFRN